jgi:Group II intron, maturase-specific domain
VSGDVHAGFCERRGVRLPPATHLVVLCATREQAEAARELVAAVLKTLGLRLAPEKTRVVQLAGGAEGFDFLGFHHRMGKSRKDGRWYLLKWPSARAMAQIRAKIREQTGRNRARLPLEWAVENVNHAVRGWGNYFRYGNSAGEVLSDRQLRQRTPRNPRQRQARTARPQLGHPLQLRVGNPARRPSPDRDGETHACVCQR